MTTESSRPAPPGFTDHPFTSVSGTELQVRVWPSTTPSPTPLPFLLVTHGGGALAGHHYTPPPWIFPGFRARGYHVVSHSYRLAPQARADEQLADCLEVLAWCRTNLPAILKGRGEAAVDVDRYALYGDSAGGWLVTLMGLHMPSSVPPPRAIVDVYGAVGLVDVYGVVDLVDVSKGWKELEGEGVREEEEQWEGEFSAAELEAFLGDRDPANILTASTAWREKWESSGEELSRRWGTEFEFTRRVRLQAELHVWRSTHPRGGALLRKAMMHPEKFAGDEAALFEFVKSMSPLQVLRQRQAAGEKVAYPPTALLHGTGDSAVPVQQSYELAKTLRELGVPVIERYEEGQEHVFDLKYTSPDVEGWNTSIQPILDFVDHYVGK